MDKEQQLKQLNATMDASCPCLLKKTATQAVPGAGNADARILFVGEAPGKSEDAQGLPFVGAAGKTLSALLASIHLRREDVYITNVVKYRPPANRDPTPQEVLDCWSWLAAQIALIDPEIIIPLGRHALERFVPGQKISHAHGKVFHRTVDGLGDRTFFALYHPAAALYNGSLRTILFADFARLDRILQKKIS